MLDITFQFIVLYNVVISIITYYFYYIDKYAARKKRKRISEIKLLTLSLIGGWIGALIARSILRHKTIKKSFILKLWITIIANICIELVILNPSIMSVLKG
ncbi:DUF1294 domain-containing protein [Aliivibrio fischeri]|uniref:DUF1294 domain-containing protein n=1 Tax=Aliivibrio fischeri TaxID=668 RepID=UPI0012D876FB|nr:DUF1294 domain-containing protein [Aliivibrio fischeri]